MRRRRSSGWKRADLLALEQDAAAVVLDQAVDHLQRGRLARARGADQHGELAALDGQRQVVDRRRAAEAPCRRARIRSPRDPSHRRLQHGRSTASTTTASATTGSTPSSTRSSALLARPWNTRAPKPPAPISAATTASPIDLHRGHAQARQQHAAAPAAPRPARTPGAASCPMPMAASTTAAGTWRRPGHGAVHDRQQRIQRQRDHRRAQADAARCPSPAALRPGPPAAPSTGRTARSTAPSGSR